AARRACGSPSTRSTTSPTGSPLAVHHCATTPASSWRSHRPSRSRSTTTGRRSPASGSAPPARWSEPGTGTSSSSIPRCGASRRSAPSSRRPTWSTRWRRPRATFGTNVPDLVPGVASALSPMVRRILAPNPGLMTGPGTNTYLVGVDEIAVIDPGPDDAGHLDAVAACGGDRIRWILTTHTHNDHSPGVAGLKARTGATVMGFDTRDGFTPDEAIGDGFCLEAT